MDKNNCPHIAVIDYGLGNLFSISRACERVGLKPIITRSYKDIIKSDGVILPGVGAFPDAMANIIKFDMKMALQDFAQTEKPIIGICLGMQLLMSRSYEFGHTEGLNIIEGSVVKLKAISTTDQPVKVPQVGWNTIFPTDSRNEANQTNVDNIWKNPILNGIPQNSFMYFVHSYFVKPSNSNDILSLTEYGSQSFCSAISKKNIIGFQFHPEKSGPKGLQIYNNLATLILTSCDK